MPVGYIYMFLALLSWSVLGVFYKLAELKHCRPITINLLLSFCAFAFLCARGILVGNLSFQAPRFVILLALFFGVNAAAATIAVQHALKLGKLSTTWLVINMATGASTIGAVLIYHEPVTFWKGMALIMMGLAMILLWKDMQKEEVRPGAKTPASEIVSERRP